MHKHRTYNLRRIPPGPQTNGNPQIPYLVILRKFPLLWLYSRRSLGMDAELFYHSRNHRNPLSAICLRMGGRLFRHLLRNSNRFIIHRSDKDHVRVMSWRLESFIASLKFPLHFNLLDSETYFEGNSSVPMAISNNRVSLVQTVKEKEISR